MKIEFSEIRYIQVFVDDIPGGKIKIHEGRDWKWFEPEIPTQNGVAKSSDGFDTLEEAENWVREFYKNYV
jgi:hypothetical protein